MSVIGKVFGGFGSWAYGAIRAGRNLAAVLVLVAAPVSADVTVAALGDSLTQGYGLSPNAGFVPVLEGWLRDNGAEVTVINAGVSGDTTRGGLSRIGWTLGDEVDALIVALGGNDVLRGIDPGEARANLSGILEAAAERQVPVLLVGIAVPGNYGPEYKAAFEAIYPDLAAEYGALHHADFLAPITGAGDRAAAVAELMQGDAIHPNAKGVRLIVEAMGPRVLELLERVRPPG
ncbi:arylesterase [Rhodophyticola sp. MJ-SS7]|nr:arylesterase [Rhodophyticola sp. MJ-SS7]MDU8945929.1 arylesterase [Rhodophyticola sp. MJ-SS7]